MAVSAPNGYFIRNMLWIDLPKGDAVLVKGFRIDLQDVSGASNVILNSLHSSISSLLYNLPDNVRMQSQWRVTSDYKEALDHYQESTLATAENDWTHFTRAEVHARLSEHMKRSVLRREEHILWFSKHVETPISKVLSTSKRVEKHLSILLEREESAFGNLGRSLQQSLGSFANVIPLDDLDNFINYRDFLNPSLLNQDREVAAREFDPEASIQELVFRSDGVKVEAENASFHFGGNYQSIFVISRWPARVQPLSVMAITSLPFNDYTITTNILPKNTREEIEKEEKLIERLEGDYASERKRSLLTSKLKKERKVDELAGGYTRLFNAVQVIRVWDQSPEGLATKCETIKAAVSDMGAQYYHLTNTITARNLFYQTWPGNLYTSYRGYDIEAGNSALACLMPFTSTFTGVLEGAEALFYGNARNVIGFRSFVGSTPQHMLVLGGTGSGKSVAMNALLSQTENIFDRTIIIEEGFSYATYTQTLGVQPIVLQLDGELTLNYLDTNGLPLSSHHVGTAAALLLMMVGVSENQDTNRHRLGMLGEYLNKLYEDSAEDWFMSHPRQVEDIQRLGYAVEELRIHHQPAGTTFLDSYLAFRELERDEPDEAAAFLASFEPARILEWSKSRDGAQTIRNLVFTKFEHEDYRDLTHNSVFMSMRYGTFPHHDAEKIHLMADMLATWTRELGQRGKFFDGISNIKLDAKVLHFELSLIPESAKDFKEAAGFLVNNVVRHIVMTDRRSSKKRIIFEEAPRFFNVPGGEEIVSAAYATYRKYSAWLVTVAQQLSQIPDNLRPVLIGNSAVKMIFRQKSSADLELLRNELKMPPVTVDTIRNYPSPEHLPAHDRYSSFTYWTEANNRLVNGTVRIYASPEMLYLASSDGDVVEERRIALARYDNILDGIQAEIANRELHKGGLTPAKKMSKLLTKISAVIAFAIITNLSVSCSSTTTREASTYGLGAVGGGGLGYAATDGDPLWTGVGTAAGIGVAALANKSADKEVIAAQETGYVKGQGDATRQHYWMLQSLQDRNPPGGGTTNTYDVTVPTAVDDFGVKTVSRRATIRIDE